MRGVVEGMSVGLSDFVRMCSTLPRPINRETHFGCGHPKTPENVMGTTKYPRCKECHRERGRIYWQNKREKECSST